MATVTLTVVRDELEAEELCGLLRVNGIPCMYRGAPVGMWRATWLTMAGPREVLVNEEDLEQARELLPDQDQSQPK